MATLYQCLAIAIVLLHLVFAGFVAVGSLLCLKWPKAIWVHMPAALWGITVELTGWVCPLTPLENDLREKAGIMTYHGDFILHHLMPVLYPESLTRQVQLLLALAVFMINAVTYTIIFRKRTKPPR